MKRVQPIPKRQRRRLYLAAWRKYRNLTQEQLAERTGITQGMISQLETGRSDFSGKVLEMLADALMCEPADLLMRDPTDDDAPWSIWETLNPPERRQAVEIIKALKRASGD